MHPDVDPGPSPRRRRYSPLPAPVFCALLAAVLAPVGAAPEPAPAAQLAIRCDDVVMCHAVNMGVEKLIATGIPFSVSDLAKHFGLGLAQYFGESSASIWDVAPEKKLSRLLRIVDGAKPGRVNLVVMHLGLESPEMSALVDRNNPRDPFRVARHRAAELAALTSPAFRRAISERRIELVTYRDVIREKGLAARVRPEGPPGYSAGDEEP